jgi:hypothetical protein
MSIFPSICPSSRSITLGKFATKRFQFISGNSTIKVYGKKSFDVELSLEFGNEGGIPDSVAATIYKCWKESYGIYSPITLPDIIFMGMKPELIAKIPPDLMWYFAQDPPFITNIRPGRSKVALKLEGRL